MIIVANNIGRISQLTLAQFASFIKQGNLAIRIGEMTFKCRSEFSSVAHSLHTLYTNHPFQLNPDFADFHVEISAPSNLRRWFRRQAEFRVDGEAPFEPLPATQAPALLEWGLNWTIAASCHQWFTIHAASVERNGRVVIFPAPPGTGKSTLCAVLAFDGWRLLSDELTLLDLETLEAKALARPINLKNASIDIIREFASQAVWGPEVFDTTKGRVTHVAPPKDSVLRMSENGLPRWIVFPKYVAGAKPTLSPRAKSQTFIDLADNAFNYSALGETGFDLVARLVDRCDCYDFVYSHLEDAIEVFDWLAESCLHDT